ncbi:MAG: hypothetical protein H0U23_08250, partial [Blastocatellia bacterium]|nr:hypothetical protein [Blastocatellia bacterium]
MRVSSMPGAADAFEPESEAPRWFTVSVDDGGHLPVHFGEKIIFHGINKSGSLCLTNVMKDAFAVAGRAAQFHSRYYNAGVSLPSFLRSIKDTPPPGFFVAHQLFGNVDLSDSNIAMITQFRHPVPRLMSCYTWLRRKYILASGSADGFPGFEVFLRKGAGKSHSQIIQFGAGYGEDQRRLVASLTTRDLFERSVENIERFVCFAGIAELFEETIFVVAHLCGIRRVSAWKRDQRNLSRPPVSTFSGATIDLIREIYYYDFELYDWAKRRFERLLSQIHIGGEIEAYREKCASQYNDRLLTIDKPDSISGDTETADEQPSHGA